jgi:hypothetical protein
MRRRGSAVTSTSARACVTSGAGSPAPASMATASSVLCERNLRRKRQRGDSNKCH